MATLFAFDGRPYIVAPFQHLAKRECSGYRHFQCLTFQYENVISFVEAVMICHREGLLLSCAVAEMFKARPQTTHFTVSCIAGQKEKKEKYMKRINACENREEAAILCGQGNGCVFTCLVPVKLGSLGCGGGKNSRRGGPFHMCK